MTHARQSPLIAMTGLPCSGKTAIALALAKQISASSFVEPEEEYWPTSVRDRDRFGKDHAFFWFRAIRADNLLLASTCRDQANIAIVDTIYESLRAFYLTNPTMSWLIDHDSPYSAVISALSAVDTRLLPAPDVLIFLRVNKDDWHRMLETRKRYSDKVIALANHFNSQEVILEASMAYASARGAELLIHDNIFSTVVESTNLLCAKLSSRLKY